MIATIMATLSSPELILLDEHCSALDPKTQKKVMALTAKIIKESDMTAMMITHHLNDAISFGEKMTAGIFSF